MPDVYVANEQEKKQPVEEEKKPVAKKRSPKEYSEVLRMAKPEAHPLSSLMFRPKHYRVEVQQEGEQILLLARRHPITNIGWMLIALVMLIASFGLPLFPFFDDMPSRFQFMTYVLWYLLVTAVVLGGFLRWYFDVFVVTDERIIDIDFNNLIYKNITSTKIDNIEDVTYNVSGAIQSLFNFGQVLIQTAGTGVQLKPENTTPTMEIWDTPKPALVAKLINELIVEEEQEKLEGRAR